MVQVIEFVLRPAWVPAGPLQRGAAGVRRRDGARGLLHGGKNAPRMQSATPRPRRWWPCYRSVQLRLRAGADSDRQPRAARDRSPMVSPTDVLHRSDAGGRGGAGPPRPSCTRQGFVTSSGYIRRTTPRVRPTPCSAKRLGVRNAYVFLTDPEEAYALGARRCLRQGSETTGATRRAARHPELPRMGLPPSPEVSGAKRVDGVFIAGLPDERTDALVRALRSEFGPDFVVIAPDSFLPASRRETSDRAGRGRNVRERWARNGAAPAASTRRPALHESLQRNPARPKREHFCALRCARDRGVAGRDPPVRRDARVDHAQALPRRLKKSVFGPFSFDRNGDPNENLLPVFRAPARAPKGPLPLDPVYTVIKVPAQLVR